MLLDRSQQLKKQLGMWDVYAISTGAMFSTGFFLLPGLAYSKTGPSVIWAYLVAALAALPGMLSKAELSTAMPRAGGTYYFLDRSLGPLAGTIGGLAAWLVMVLKSAFSLLGIGAYLVIFFDLPVKPFAAGLVVAFMVLNLVGAKQTTGLQRFLVAAITVFAAALLVDGVLEIIGDPDGTSARFSPAFTHGSEGFFATVGFVFVSYAGLTKVASVAEEVENPDRNLPLGMSLSLLTTAMIYACGLGIMIALVEPAELVENLAPMATVADRLFTWLPSGWGAALAAAAAVAAFSSTGNAGLMSASRYPLAMARDRLLPDRLGRLGRSKMPVAGIWLSSALMLVFVLAMSEEGLAKLASAVQLLLFAFINLAVIVMREAHIPSYDAGYKSPLYPWTQILGIGAPLWMIAEMGAGSIAFTAALVVLCGAWYFGYARQRVDRHGAIYHIFERLGRRRFEGLDRELRGIMKEKGLRDSDPFDDLVARAAVLETSPGDDFDRAVEAAAAALSERLGLPASELEEGFIEGTRIGGTPVSHGAALPHLRLHDLEHAHLVMVRSADGVRIDPDEMPSTFDDPGLIHALFFLASPEGDPGRHLRILAQIAGRVDDEGFLDEWLTADDDQTLREVVLRDERFLSLPLLPGSRAAEELTERTLRNLSLPTGCLVTLVRRHGVTFVPDGSTVLQEDDRLTIIGAPHGIAELHKRYDEA